MAEVQWIKVSADIYDNRKIRQIDAMPNGDSLMNVWYKLLTLAGRINRGGKLLIADGVPYTEEMLATEFGRSVEVVREALGIFRAYQMIEKRGKVWTVKNWAKHQNAEGLEAIREYNREAQKRCREAKKNNVDVNDNVNDKSMTVNDKSNNVNDNVNDKAKEKRSKREKGDIDKDIDIDKEYISPSYDVEITRASARELGDGDGENASGFVPPTVDQVKAFCAEKGLLVDPYRFVEYYSSPERSWRGVTDWRARLMSWHRKDAQDAKEKGQSRKTHSSFETSDAFEAALRRSYGEQYDEFFGEDHANE